jgi:hypothetical protein
MEVDMQLDLTTPSDINNPGEPGSLQRICFQAARISTLEEWVDLNNAIHAYHEWLGSEGLYDTRISLLLNALGVAVEEVVELRKLGTKIVNPRKR